MDKETSANSLMERLKRNQERFSLLGPKPQDLTRSEMVSRVEDFLLLQEELAWHFSFGDAEEKDEAPKGTVHFDPVEIYNSNPEHLEKLVHCVEFDMNGREEQLLDEAKRHRSSYNTLLFGAAIKLHKKETLSDGLRDLVVDHLISKPASTKQKEKGGQRKDPIRNDCKYEAIQFVCLHGFKATRFKDSARNSACDIIEDAALSLWKKGHTQFGSGYRYDNLQAIYSKKSKTRSKT
jgi:hypothetical protein